MLCNSSGRYSQYFNQQPGNVLRFTQSLSQIFARNKSRTRVAKIASYRLGRFARYGSRRHNCSTRVPQYCTKSWWVSAQNQVNIFCSAIVYDCPHRKYKYAVTSVRMWKLWFSAFIVSGIRMELLRDFVQRCKMARRSIHPAAELDADPNWPTHTVVPNERMCNWSDFCIRLHFYLTSDFPDSPILEQCRWGLIDQLENVVEKCSIRWCRLRTNLWCPNWANIP